MPVDWCSEDEDIRLRDLPPDQAEVVILDAVSFPAIAPALLAGEAGPDVHLVEVEQLDLPALGFEAVEDRLGAAGGEAVRVGARLDCYALHTLIRTRVDAINFI